MIKMSKCTKCGTVVDQPKKTWKIKQTPVALFECPSCNAKWRSKFVETPTISLVVPTMVQATIPEPVSSIQATVTGRVENNISLIEEIKTVADNIQEPERATGIFSGIRTFLTSFFSAR